MNTSLNALRADWEEGLKEISVSIDKNDAIIVVLQDPEQEANGFASLKVHRYFQIGSNWVVSVDVR